MVVCWPKTVHVEMEDEEDLEALRAAALQSINRKKIEPAVDKRTYVHPHHRGSYIRNNTHYYQSKKPFIRADHNPNLILIVPTEGSVASSSPRDVPRTGDEKVEGETSILNKTEEKIAAAKADTTVQKQHSPTKVGSKQISPIKECSSPEKPKKAQPRPSLDKDDELDLDFDEEELDFECEGPLIEEETEDEPETTVPEEEEEEDVKADESEKITLEDDEVSLDKLMDEMEQEFSGKPIAKVDKSSAKPKVQSKNEKKIETKKKKSPSPKEILPLEKESTSLSIDRVAEVKKSSPPRWGGSSRSPLHSKTRNEDLGQPSSLSYRRSRSPRRISRSPLRRLSRSPRRMSRSPRRFSRSPRRLSRSPRRQSRSPRKSPLSLRSRSPLCQRSKSPYRRTPPGRRSKSPLRRRTPPRRLSPGLKRSPRRSPPLHLYRSRSRSYSAERRRPLDRKNLSPRRWSPSPPLRGSYRRRTPPPSSRVANPKDGDRNRPSRRRTASPPVRQPLSRRSSLTRRPLRSRNSPEFDARQNIPRARTPEQRPEPDTRKKSHLKVVNDNGEADKKKTQAELGSEVDPKLEARRRKFENTAPLSLSMSKKICLKSNSGDVGSIPAKNNQGSTDCSPNDAVHEEENDELSPSASRTQLSSVYKTSSKSPSAEARLDRRRIISSNNREPTTNSSSPLVILDNDDGEVRSTKPVSIRYTVADAKEEIELEKLRRKRRTAQMLEEEKLIVGEGFDEALTIKKKKKKKDKDKTKKKEKKKKALEVVDLVIDTKRKGRAVDESGAGAGSTDGQDLRAALSRRRAQRLQGQPGSRLIQSAFEFIVDKKVKAGRLESSMAESNKADDSSKSKGRRVHVVAASIKKKHEDNPSGSEESDGSSKDHNDVREVPEVRHGGILRGTNIRGRSQVLKQ